MAEVYRLYPDLRGNEAKAPVTKRDLPGLMLAAPVGFAVYMAVHLAVRARPAADDWTRGR